METSDLNPADDPHKVEDWETIKPKKGVKKVKRFWDLPDNQKNTIISKEDIKEIVADFDALLDEMGFPGGAGVGLSLPGGYINGAPDSKDVKKNSKKLNNKGMSGYEEIDEIAVQTDKIPGGLAKGKTLIDLAKKYDPKEYYDPKQFAAEYIKPQLMKGIKVEMEHTTDVRIATEIAMDHLWEDLHYYEKLTTIENETTLVEYSGNEAFDNDMGGTTGHNWNNDWDEYDAAEYYLEDLEGWENMNHKSDKDAKVRKNKVPIFNHDDIVGKYNRIAKYGLKLPQDFIKEALIIEGGAYGHMNHPFDISMNLTFGDLKQIVVRALNGDLDLAREKTDGQALAISWVNGRLVAARNKSHLKNKGVGAMSAGDVAKNFAGRGALTDAYTFAMKDLSTAVSALSDAQKKKIFKDGACFMNLEVIYPKNANVIPYGQNLLVFHGTFEYDVNGEVIGENQQAASILAGMIKQVNKHVQSTYTIQGPPMLSLPKSEELTKKQGKYISMISKLQSEYVLSDSDGVADYHQAYWANLIDKNAKGLDAQQKIGLVKRWAFGDKGFRIADIKDAKIKAWADGIDKKDQAKISKENIMKFEEIFLGVGADVLAFMQSVLTANPSEATKKMRAELGSAIKSLKATGTASQLDKLKIELQRLNSLGGFDKIVPNEGLVFVYNGNTYKLTGAFAPLNQILGIFKFSR